MCTEKSLLKYESEVMVCSGEGLSVNIQYVCQYNAKTNNENIQAGIESAMYDIFSDRFSKTGIKDLLNKREIFRFNPQDIKDINQDLKQLGIKIRSILIKKVIFSEQIQEVVDLKNRILNEKQKLESLLGRIADLPEKMKKDYAEEIENHEILIQGLENNILAIDKWGIYEKIHP
ncbi:MAG: hypothetical protein JW822_06670 [Spirochaetales bacterium]|nr:hypothetical protein [Spirochaetales bacterium]